MTTRVRPRHFWSAASCRSSSMPVITGMLMSVSSSCTSRDSRIASASAPFPASNTSSTGTSARVTTRLMRARIIDESSTIRIRMSDLLHFIATREHAHAAVLHSEMNRACHVAAEVLCLDEDAVTPEHLFGGQGVALAGSKRQFHRRRDFGAADQLHDRPALL